MEEGGGGEAGGISSRFVSLTESDGYSKNALYTNRKNGQFSVLVVFVFCFQSSLNRNQ